MKNERDNHNFKQLVTSLGKENFYIQEAIVIRRIFRKLNITENTNKQIEFIEFNGKKIREFTKSKMNRGDK